MTGGGLWVGAGAGAAAAAGAGSGSTFALVHAAGISSSGAAAGATAAATGSGPAKIVRRSPAGRNRWALRNAPPPLATRTPARRIVFSATFRLLDPARPAQRRRRAAVGLRKPLRASRQSCRGGCKRPDPAPDLVFPPGGGAMPRDAWGEC